MAASVSKEWKALNETLLAADVPTCYRLLNEEFNGRRRQRYVLRIHSRLNYVRAHQERLALLEGRWPWGEEGTLHGHRVIPNTDCR